MTATEKHFKRIPPANAGGGGWGGGQWPRKTFWPTSNPRQSDPRCPIPRDCGISLHNHKAGLSASALLTRPCSRAALYSRQVQQQAPPPALHPPHLTTNTITTHSLKDKYPSTAQLRSTDVEERNLLCGHKYPLLSLQFDTFDTQ